MHRQRFARCAGLFLSVLLAAVLAAPSFLSCLPQAPRSAEVRPQSDFPCQGHQCGCRSRTQCLTRCCCGTPKGSAATLRHLDVPVTIAESAGAGVVLRDAMACAGDSVWRPGPDLNAPAFFHALPVRRLHAISGRSWASPSAVQVRPAPAPEPPPPRTTSFRA